MRTGGESWCPRCHSEDVMTQTMPRAATAAVIII